MANNMNLLFELDTDTGIDIPGLTYIPDFITRDQEAPLIASIDKQPCHPLRPGAL